MLALVLRGLDALSLQLPDRFALSQMIARVYHVVVDAIETISVFPLFSRFARVVVLEIRPDVNLVTYLVVVSTPVSDFHLVMGVKCCCIEDVDVTVLKGRPTITLPEICMNQTRLEGSSICYQSVQKPRDDM